MKDKIPDFLRDKLLVPKSVAKKFPIEIQQFMIDYAKFYGWDLSSVEKNKKASKIQTIFLLMSKNLSRLPKCEFPGCNEYVYITYHQKLARGCCHGHSQKISVLEKYDVDTVAKLQDTKEKIMSTCLKKYGETSNLKTNETKRKIKKTNLEKYGVEYPMQSDDVKLKRQYTFNSKYGVDEITSSEHFKRKFKTTMLEKYGVTSALQNKDILKKCQETNMDRYGVHNPTLNSSILEKAQHNSFLRKEFTWKTGETSLVQGNEPIVLKELEDDGYSFNEVKTSPKDMPDIWYEFEGETKKYIPDFFIPKENLLIEVKSDFTLNLEPAKNNAKFQAAKDAGYNFRLEVR